MRRFAAVSAACLGPALSVSLSAGARAGSGAAGASAPSSGVVGAQSSHATAQSAPGSFSKTVTVTRDSVVNGSDEVVDSRTVTLNVDQTQNLQGRQEIHVSWSGAHPTGGIVADQNSAAAQDEEYPFVLLECRGTDSSSAPASEQLSPETCWTQTWSEHYQDSLGDQYPPYRLDEYATTADRAAIVGAPSPLPASCQYDESAPVQHWVPFVAADGQVYDGGNAGCAGEPPESQDVGGSGLPSNETFGVTGTDGSGSADFDVWTSTENASLGCSQTVACSLVAVPIMGISCDPSTGVPSSDISQCEETGAFAPGQLMPAAGGGDLTVSGSLWWSPSNWRNRITVPLSFAVPPGTCSGTGSSKAIDVYGSELMIQATGQWEPYFCLDASNKFDFVHVQTGEPQARNLVATGGAEAAFTSDAQPGGYGKPVVNAPVAVTGFAISYAIDGTNGQPYTTLKLTPLLLAKLLTESYPGDNFMKQDDPALAGNPVNITEDPEFQALNPGITPSATGNTEAASELIALSSDSDVIEALTTYINDDPTARAWLNGQPDQWGMVVNPAYKGIALPVDQWPLLSTFEPTAFYDSDDGQNNNCLYTDPVPFQPLVAAPLASLEDISESLQYDLPNSTTTCSQPNAPSSEGEELVTAGRQEVGYRFMIGITPLADNQRYGLEAASLETTSGKFVAPDETSLEAAASLLAPDPSSGTWPIPYQQFSQPAGASAYPGTMVVYAAVPTEGLPAADAQDLASLLEFAATTGQQQGSGVGQLPPGYLPLTAADGLGTLAAYTEQAVPDVAAQNGQVPPLVPVASDATAGSGSDAGGGDYPGWDGESSGASSAPPGTSAGPNASSGHSKRGPSKHQPAVGMLSLDRAVGAAFWMAGFPLWLVLALALLGVVAVPVIFRFGRRLGRW